MHITLGRLVATAPLSEPLKTALLEACAAETSRLTRAGLRLELGMIEYVEETVLGTSSGRLTPIAL